MQQEMQAERVAGLVEQYDGWERLRGKLVSAEDSLWQVGRRVSSPQYCFDGRLFIRTGNSADQVTGRLLEDDG